MDDFSISSLHESKSEWGSRLLTIMTPLIMEGLKSIFDEAYKLCKENDETDKYLMTFQNFLTRIPKWNTNIIENERKRICERSGCGYLEDLVTCVHIIQLKLLTAIRVGNKQKKIDINIPKLDDFIHKTYIHVARKIYKNVYLFEINIQPLQIQKNHRELEIIIQECILNTVRESIPIESILRAYMDETIEEDVIEEIKEERIEDPEFKEKKEIEEDVKKIIKENDIENNIENNIENKIDNKLDYGEEQKGGRLYFNDVDLIKESDGKEISIEAPKTIERLEELYKGEMKYPENDNNNEEENIKIKIKDENVNLDNLDVHEIREPEMELLPDLLIDDVEVLV